MHVLQENLYTMFEISLNFVSIGNTWALVNSGYVLPHWCRTGDEPLPEPIKTQFTDAYTLREIIMESP